MSNNKQYKFTKIAINKDESKLIEVSVQKFEFEVGGNKKGIEKIVFKGSKDQDIENKDDLVAKLNKDGGLELSFDNEKVEIKEKKTTVTAKVSVASNTVESQDEEEEEQLPLIEVDAEAKTLTIEWKSDVFTITEKVATEDGQDNNEGGGSSNQNSETDIKATPCQKKLAAIDAKMKKHNINESGLTDEGKNNYQKLKNNQITEENVLNSTEKKITDEVCKTAAETKLADLNTRVDNAIKSGKKEDMKALEKELNGIIGDTDYQTKKAEFELLNKKVKDKINEITNTQNGNNIPWKIIIPVGLIIIVAIAALIYSRQNKAENE